MTQGRGLRRGKRLVIGATLRAKSYRPLQHRKKIMTFNLMSRIYRLCEPLTQRTFPWSNLDDCCAIGGYFWLKQTRCETLWQALLLMNLRAGIVARNRNKITWSTGSWVECLKNDFSESFPNLGLLAIITASRNAVERVYNFLSTEQR